MLVRHSVQCKPTASLKEMMSSQCGGLLEGGALTSDATRKSVMPTAASVVNSHSGLSSRAWLRRKTHFSQPAFLFFIFFLPMTFKKDRHVVSFTLSVGRKRNRKRCCNAYSLKKQHLQNCGGVCKLRFVFLVSSGTGGERNCNAMRFGKVCSHSSDVCKAQNSFTFLQCFPPSWMEVGGFGVFRGFEGRTRTPGVSTDAQRRGEGESPVPLALLSSELKQQT